MRSSLRLCLWTAFGALVLPATVIAAATPADRPNVVLIVADDLGYGDVGCYGSTVHRTPHIDALATAGVRFTQFRVNPLCAPTRAAFMTGMYSLETGMWRGPSRGGENTAGDEEGEESAAVQPRRNNRERRNPDEAGRARELHRDLRLLPEMLKESGYATGMFGKWHLGYESPNVPNARGFEEFVGFLGGAHPYEPSRGEAIQRNGEPIQDGRHLTDLFTDEAIEFIESRRDRPFFCYVPYNAVHGPLWSTDRPRASGKPEWLAKGGERGLEFPLRDYCAVLEHMDDGIGRIMAALRRLGLDDRTLVIFVSDNGALEDKYPGNNGPLRGQKGETYEGGVRVPAVMRWPGVIPSGTVSDAPAVAADLFATILDAASGEVPQDNGGRSIHGVSLLGHLRSGASEPLPERYHFWDLYGDLGAYHAGWKLVGAIENHRGRFAEALPHIEAAEFQLYYLPGDIGETRDLASERPEVYSDLKRRLIEWFKKSTR